MTQQGAERAVTISALIVAGVYIYRRLTEGAGPVAKTGKLAQLTGQGSPPPAGTFITAWGFAFLVISIVASAAPGLGGSFAILVAVGDLLGNGQQVAKDVNSKLGTPAGTGTTAAGTTPAATPPNATGPGSK